ncbi:acyl carrier protein [Pseudoalteromonas sp. JBTF-M23]|uniref:Acyl carrier protein n=1 Tax=Pseudoalteromonas caenipelagi TaxID=2726988 RepID=A0A849VCK6_9GAMM|nr:acyl carrier protein [Pseudoalteromonas caenipelagi]NOU50785.1 acyl carrier protein [Pseudoalteromonas caenipelagi]
MSNEALYSFFQDFFEARGVILPTEIEDYNFIASGVLDSFEVLSLIMQIELEFSVSFSPEELLDEKNASIGGLISSIQAKL